MKKLCSVLLAIIMTFSSTMPVFAEEFQQIREDTLQSQYNQYEATEYDEVYFEATANEYIMRVENSGNDEIYIPVEKISIDINNVNKVDAFLNRTDIPREVLDDFETVYEQQAQLKNTDFTATLFVPKAALASSDPDKIYHKDSYGRDMLSYKYFYTNQSTGWKDVKRGSGVKELARSLKTVILATAGMASKAVSYLQSGASILQAFYDYYSVNNVTASTSDYLQARLVWDETKQYTYAYDGAWQLGLYTSYITLKKVGIEEYFYKSGKAPYTSDRTVNIHIYSKHYYDPWDYASAHIYNYVEERIKWSTNGLTFYF